jgi:hypothetical protein
MTFEIIFKKVLKKIFEIIFKKVLKKIFEIKL